MTTLFDSDKPDQFDTPFIDEDYHIDWRSRLIIVGEEYGFQPTTREELNRFTVLAASLDTPRSTIGHLNEVLKHQSRYGADPQAAIVSVVDSYGLYAKDASLRGDNLITFREVLDETNPELAIEHTDASESRGLLDVLQFKDILWARQVGQPRPLEGGVKNRAGKKVLATHYDHAAIDDTHLQVITDNILKMRVRDAKDLAHQAQSSHAVREKFWIQRIRESQKHGAARKAAILLLESLE